MRIPDDMPALMQQIDATALLDSRPRRPVNWQAEAEAWEKLTNAFVNQPATLAQALADTALALTGAQASGISLDQSDAAQPVFRWIATSGTYSCYLNGTMPRHFSPCGEVVSRNAPVLMREMRKLYTYVEALNESPHEVLLVPFHHLGKPVGTVWIVRHDDARGFDAEDLRVIQKLTRFAGSAVERAGLYRQLEEQNQQQQTEMAVQAQSLGAMEDADARKDQFMAALAHEMRSPLGAISMATQVIKLNDHAAHQRALMVAAIERQVKLLVSLTKDMTDIAAIRSGKLVLSKSPINIQELVANTLETCHDLLQSKHQHVDIQLPEEPLLMEGDMRRLTQVMVNLLNNAAKYSPEQSHIVLRGHRSGDTVELSVTDAGIGLEPALLPSVFDMYMQVHTSDRPHPGGLGIGLALVKQLVELHQGHVFAASEGLGKGCTFRVQLPLQPLPEGNQSA